MAEFLVLDLWVADWVRDTKHLRPLERGIYMDMMILAWDQPKCRLPNDPKWISKQMRYTRAEQNALKRVVEEFWRPDSHRKWITQKRLSKEFAAALRRKSESLRAASARWHKGNGNSAYAITDTDTDTGSAPYIPRKRGTAHAHSKTRRKRSNIDEAFADLERAEERQAQRSQNGSPKNSRELS